MAQELKDILDKMVELQKIIPSDRDALPTVAASHFVRMVIMITRERGTNINTWASLIYIAFDAALRAGFTPLEIEKEIIEIQISVDEKLREEMEKR